MNRKLWIITLALLSVMLAGSQPPAIADTPADFDAAAAVPPGTKPDQSQSNPQAQPGSPAGQQDFQDVPPTDPFYTYLNNIYDDGIVVGYPCGGAGEPCVPPDNLPYYRPSNYVTRAQMSKFVDLARKQASILISTDTEPLPLFSNTFASNGYGVWGKADTGPNARGVYGTSASAYGVFGASTASDGIGVYGSSTAAGGYGVSGFASIGIGVRGESAGSSAGVRGVSASGRGVAGEAMGTDGQGVYGVANNGSEARGVYGLSSSGTGVYGEATGIGGRGVYGTSTSGEGVYGFSSANNGTGVYGYASTGDGATGVYGFSSSGRGVYGFANCAFCEAIYGSSSLGFAGYFVGDGHFSGNLSKGGGSFKIDHPLDPENKYLYHSFVESPDMMNVYNGNVTLDANGEAWVQMPDWFEALNKEFRYQLTTIGGFAPVYVAEKVKENRFKIAGGKPGLEVSWQVTGIRHDPYANANRIPVEEEKKADEQGKYLHAAEWGQPESKGVDYEATHSVP